MNISKDSTNLKEKNISQRKKIIGIFLSFFFFLLILINSIFGLLNFNTYSDYKIDNNYKNYYEFQIDVDWRDNDINENEKIYDIADYFNNELESNENYYSSNVYVVDNDTILIDTPIESITNFYYDQNEYQNNDNLYKPFSNEAQVNLLKEIIFLQSILINQNYLEFRTYDGNLLFQNGIFIEPSIETTDPSAPSQTENYNSVSNPQGNLIEKASVDFSNGSPYIRIYPKDLNIFRDAVNWYESQINSPSQDPNAKYWTIWFGYDQLENILTTGTEQGIFDYAPSPGDPSTGTPKENVYTYIHTDENGELVSNLTKKFASAYYVSIGQLNRKPTTVYNDYFSIYGDFTVAQANNIVDRINFSNTTNEFNLSIVNYNLINNQTSIKSLVWVFWLFITFVILVAFFFFTWFGLLGLIASSVNLLGGLLIAFTINIFALPLSFSLLATLFLITIFTSILSFSILSNYKNTKNEFWKPFTKYKKNVGRFSATFLPIVFIISISFLIGGLLLPMVIQVYLYLLIFAFLVILFLDYLFLFGMLYAIDFFTNFTEIKDQKNWNYLTGVDYQNLSSKNKYLKKLNEKTYFKEKKSSIWFRTFSFVTIILLLFTGLVFSTNFYSNNSGLNKNFSNDSLYKYDVVKTYSTSIKDTYSSYVDEPVASDNDYQNRLSDPQNQTSHLNEINQNKSDILDIFRQNDIYIDHYKIIRYDRIIENKTYKPDLNDGTIVDYDFQFSYGISIYSPTEITQNDFLTLNSELANLTYFSEDNNLKYTYYNQLLNTPDYFYYDYYYQLIPTSSISINDNFANENDWRSYYQDQYDLEAKNNTTLETLSAPNSYFVSQNVKDYSVNKLNDTSFTFVTNNYFLAILIILLLALFFITIIYRFATVFSILITTFLELIFAISITILCFIPFTFVFYFVFLTSILFSLITKLMLFKKSKAGEIKFKDRNVLLMSSLLVLNFIIFTFVFIIFGSSFVIGFFFSFVFMIISIFSNLKIYPYLLLSFDKRFRKNKVKRKERDLLISKQENIIFEEIIEGIND